MEFIIYNYNFITCITLTRQNNNFLNLLKKKNYTKTIIFYFR